MIMQPQQTSEELSNLFIQSIEAKDERAILKILECDDETKIRDIVNRIPAHHVRRLVLELRNVLSDQLTITHLQWLQQVLILKFSALSSMADSRSVILPLISLLEDRSSPAYYMKMQALKGKLSLLKQLKETRASETQETVVRVPADREQSSRMEVDSDSDTDSEEDFVDDEDEDENGIDIAEGGEDDELASGDDEDVDQDENKSDHSDENI